MAELHYLIFPLSDIRESIIGTRDCMHESWRLKGESRKSLNAEWLRDVGVARAGVLRVFSHLSDLRESATGRKERICIIVRGGMRD